MYSTLTYQQVKVTSYTYYAYPLQIIYTGHLIKRINFMEKRL